MSTPTLDKVTVQLVLKPNTTSPVWKHFALEVDKWWERKSEERWRGSLLVTRSNTSNLIAHLRTTLCNILTYTRYYVFWEIWLMILLNTIYRHTVVFCTYWISSQNYQYRPALPHNYIEFKTKILNIKGSKDWSLLQNVRKQ